MTKEELEAQKSNNGTILLMQVLKYFMTAILMTWCSLSVFPTFLEAVRLIVYKT